MPILLKVASSTHPGQVRQTNEDAIFTFVRPPEQGEPLGLFIVADGMGGHLAGEVASQLVVETMEKELHALLTGQGDTTHISRVEESLRSAIEKANAAIHEYAQKNPAEAGNLASTVTCALVRGETVVIANVGDSRTYSLAHNELTQITEDHSYVARLVKEGQIQPEALYTHPHRSVIIRALGYEPAVEVDVWSRPFEVGERVLLCSDGLWEMIRDAQIKQRLASSLEAETVVQALINDANAEGGVDNVSVIIIDMVENGK